MLVLLAERPAENAARAPGCSAAVSAHRISATQRGTYSASTERTIVAGLLVEQTLEDVAHDFTRSVTSVPSMIER